MAPSAGHSVKGGLRGHDARLRWGYPRVCQLTGRLDKQTPTASTAVTPEAPDHHVISVALRFENGLGKRMPEPGL